MTHHRMDWHNSIVTFPPYCNVNDSASKSNCKLFRLELDIHNGRPLRGRLAAPQGPAVAVSKTNRDGETLDGGLSMVSGFQN